MSVAAVSPTGTRRVSILLILGILFVPYIFVWFLLRSGYSSRARIIGFGWLAIIVAVVVQTKQAPSNQTTASSGAASVDPIDPYRSQKEGAAALARIVVPKAMKDPSSAEFGRVWGMTAGIACGYVNGKNSFGAMVGQRGFIMAGGAVEFEGSPKFAQHWNTLCIDKLLSKPPEGAMGMRWGGRPAATLKATMSPTEDGLVLYQSKAAPEPLEGVAVKENDFRFQHGALYAADFYIDGEAHRDAIRAALVTKFGPPLSYDENVNSYTWEWPKRHITVEMRYEDKFKRTTVTYAHGAH